MTLQWSFGDRLRKIRLECTDLTQIGIAAVLGVSPATVGAWESGRSTPGKHLVTVAQKIEKAWGVPAAWTLGLTPDPPVVRHQGLEPRTRWLSAGHERVKIENTDGHNVMDRAA